MRLLLLSILCLTVRQVYSCTAKNCKTCSASSTTSCLTCSDGFFKAVFTDSGCLGQCTPNCNWCSTTTNCFTCRDGFYLYSTSSGCSKCPDGCKKCVGTSATRTTCVSCNDGFQLELGECKGTAIADEGSSMGVVIGATLPFALVMIGLLVVAFFMANSSKYKLPTNGANPNNSSMMS